MQPLRSDLYSSLEKREYIPTIAKDGLIKLAHVKNHYFSARIVILKTDVNVQYHNLPVRLEPEIKKFLLITPSHCYNTLFRSCDFLSY